MWCDCVSLHCCTDREEMFNFIHNKYTDLMYTWQRWPGDVAANPRLIPGDCSREPTLNSELSPARPGCVYMVICSENSTAMYYKNMPEVGKSEESGPLGRRVLKRQGC